MNKVYGIEIDGTPVEWYVTRGGDGRLAVEVSGRVDLATAFSERQVVESAVAYLARNGYNAKLVVYVQAGEQQWAKSTASN